MTVNQFSNCTYSSTHLAVDVPALTTTFEDGGFFNWNTVIYTLLSVMMAMMFIVFYYLEMCNRIIPKEQPKECSFGYHSTILCMYIIGISIVSPLIQVVLYASFYSLWQTEPSNFSFQEVACITKIKGFPIGGITGVFFCCFVLFIFFKKNSSSIFNEKRQRMEKLAAFMKPVSSIQPGQTARLLTLHAGRGLFLDVIADIFSRNCRTTFEIIALECFETKYFSESDYWLKENTRIMGLGNCVKSVWCDFKSLPIPSNTIDVVLHGFDNGGSRLMLMGLPEDLKSIYRVLKPDGIACFFGQANEKYKEDCINAGFVEYQVIDTVRFFMFISLSVVVMKKPSIVVTVDSSSIEDGVNIDNKMRLTTLRTSALNNRPNNINQILSSQYFFPPGKANRLIEFLCFTTFGLFILYAVFCVGTYQDLSVPSSVPYSFYVSTNFISNLNVIPYSFIFLYPQLRDAANDSSDNDAAVSRVLLRYKQFMVWLILSLLCYNWLFYVLSLIIYLIVVNGFHQSQQRASITTTITVIVICIILYRQRGRITQFVSKVNSYFKKVEDDSGSGRFQEDGRIKQEYELKNSIHSNDLKAPILNPIIATRIDS